MNYKCMLRYIAILLFAACSNNTKIFDTTANCGQNCGDKNSNATSAEVLNIENNFATFPSDILPNYKFTHGFLAPNSLVNAPKVGSKISLRPPNDGIAPSWELAQFWSQSGLTNSSYVGGGCLRKWTNAYKGVSLGCTSAGKVYDLLLGVNTSKEYNKTYQNFPPDENGKYNWPNHPKWVHLTVSGKLNNVPTLNRIKNLNFTIKAKLLGSQIYTPSNCPTCLSPEKYNPNTSIFHYTHQLVIRNTNAASPYKGQGITIIVPMYDSREKLTPAWQDVDPVMHILMYRLAQTNLTNGASMHSGNEVNFSGDLIGKIKEGIAYGCSHSSGGANPSKYLGSCALSDYTPVTVVFGWEAHGLGTATIGISDYHIRLTPQ